LVTVAFVPPFNVTDIDFGGQVVKYPADDPDPAIEAEIAVVPGCAAVITLVAAFSVATLPVLTEYESVPIELEHDGTDVTPVGNLHA